MISTKTQSTPLSAKAFYAESLKKYVGPREEKVKDLQKKIDELKKEKERQEQIIAILHQAAKYLNPIARAIKSGDPNELTEAWKNYYSWVKGLPSSAQVQVQCLCDDVKRNTHTVG